LYGVRIAIDPFTAMAVALNDMVKGVGMDEVGFSQCIVRFQPYLRQVNEAFLNKFGKDLEKLIRYETTGIFTNLLIAIVENAVESGQMLN